MSVGLVAVVSPKEGNIDVLFATQPKTSTYFLGQHRTSYTGSQLARSGAQFANWNSMWPK